MVGQEVHQFHVGRAQVQVFQRPTRVRGVAQAVPMKTWSPWRAPRRTASAALHSLAECLKHRQESGAG
jgi:hypothetical protein